MIRKHWIHLGFQICKLYLQQKNNQRNITTQSYNEIAAAYDNNSPENTNEFINEMICRIHFPKIGKVVDLTCGTGCFTNLISKHFDGEVIGVDISHEMLKIAKEKYGDSCQFVCRDAMEFLQDQPSESIDVVTCAWGLGYLQLNATIREISRVLKPAGHLAVIDNSLSSVYEIVISGISTIAEYPTSVINIMHGQWVFTKGSLARRMRRFGLQVIFLRNGETTYYANNEKNAIDFLLNTGTVAGFQYCIDPNYSKIIKQRFGEIFKKSYGTEKGLPITHRFIIAVGKKPAKKSTRLEKKCPYM